MVGNVWQTLLSLAAVSSPCTHPSIGRARAPRAPNQPNRVRGRGEPGNPICRGEPGAAWHHLPPAWSRREPRHCQLWQPDLICRRLNASDHCAESLTLTRVIEFKVDCLWPSSPRSSKCTYSLQATRLNGLHSESCSNQPAWYAEGEEGTNCMLELRIRLWKEWENEDRSLWHCQIKGSGAQEYDIEIYGATKGREIWKGSLDSFSFF